MPEPTPPHGTAEHGATGPVNPSVRFEHTDANVRNIVFFGIALVVVSVLTHLLVTGLFSGLSGREKPVGPVQPTISQDRLRLPRDLKKVPAPRLQIDQERDLAELYQRDRDLLRNEKQPYRWVDAEVGIVRIPIERAMELLAEPKTAAAHGLRARLAQHGEGK